MVFQGHSKSCTNYHQKQLSRCSWGTVQHMDKQHSGYQQWLSVLLLFNRDVTDSESVSESDGIRQFFRNPKSDGYRIYSRISRKIYDKILT